jgi:hypothetical protein
MEEAFQRFAFHSVYCFIPCKQNPERKGRVVPSLKTKLK